MGKLLDFMRGRRTYATMAVIIILGLIDGWNSSCASMPDPVAWCINVRIPEWVFALLGALGIYTRSLANKK